MGRPVEHLSAARHATGEAVFISDEVSRRGELHLALITSTKPHARILYGLEYPFLVYQLRVVCSLNGYSYVDLVLLIMLGWQ